MGDKGVACRTQAPGDCRQRTTAVCKLSLTSAAHIAVLQNHSISVWDDGARRHNQHLYKWGMQGMAAEDASTNSDDCHICCC